MRHGIVLAIVMLMVAGGCRAPARVPTTGPAVVGLSPWMHVESVRSGCYPPQGWKPDPLKQTSNHAHQVWISPSGNTAYGVILAKLPFPLSHDLVLWGFLEQMKREDGRADLLERHWDADLRGIRFTVEGNLYTMRAVLMVRGFECWTVYAGTHTREPIVVDELALAMRARDHTMIDADPAATQSP